MQLALAYGSRGLGQTWPNPSVGCLIVKDGKLVARGRTGTGGRPHAESIAIEKAQQQAAGSTAYVTLEPCAHTGKTPPCTDLLAASRVARVVTPLSDPDSRVSGRGHKRLREAGVEVACGCLEREAVESHLGFLLRLRLSRPMVTLKLAHSLDGRVATSTGQSKWISGPASRRVVHSMRASHDAVMVGKGTALADDPELTPRDAGVRHVPVRIVLDSALESHPSCKLGRSVGQGPVWICHGSSAPVDRAAVWRSAGAETIQCRDGSTGGLDPGDVMSKLAQRGLTRVYCEGGPTLAASLLSAGLVDRLICFAAGLALGATGKAMIGPLDCPEIASAPRFILQRQARVGEDVMEVWTRPLHTELLHGIREFC